MAEADWTVCEESLDANTIRRGATQGITPPAGGGGFVYAFNSALTADGAAALFYNGDGFAPYPEGSSIRAAIQKGASGGTTGFSPLIFTGLQGESVDDSAYFLGFTNNEPHKIALCKGSLSAGFLEAAILRQSDANFSLGLWHHLRLDMVVNGNGDVALSVWRSDLAEAPLDGAAAWEAIPGMATFIDDAVGINSGSLPLTGGRSGFGFWATQVTRRGYVAELELLRQVPA